MEGLLSSPGWGCVTSAPNIIVGTSDTWGILLANASFNIVFVPPTYIKSTKTRLQFKRNKRFTETYILSSLSNNMINSNKVFKWITSTFTFILRARFSRYCLFILTTCLGWQHWDTIPNSVSQMRFIFPVRTKWLHMIEPH